MRQRLHKARSVIVATIILYDGTVFNPYQTYISYVVYIEHNAAKPPPPPPLLLPNTVIAHMAI